VPGSFACVRRCSPSERGRRPRWRDGVSRREPQPSSLHKGDACDHSRIEGAVIHRDELGLQRLPIGRELRDVDHLSHSVHHRHERSVDADVDVPGVSA
jgi:hypothetical protein